MIGISEFLSFVGGIVAGLLTNMLWDLRFPLARSLRRVRGQRRAVSGGVNSLELGLYPINRWSESRSLGRHQLKVHVQVDRPDHILADNVEWLGLVREFGETSSGDTAYLIDFDVDHRENDRGDIFGYTVSPCDYSEHLATVEYLARHPETRQSIVELFQSGLIANFARAAPPASVKINVAVLNPYGRFLAVQRSGAVDAKRGLWTVGPNETMRLPRRRVPGVPVEDFFGMAERCLHEELGMRPLDTESITISWLGYDVNSASVKVFAQARSRLSESEIEDAMANAHSIFELQQSVWLPLSRKILQDVREHWSIGDSAGRRWSSSAPLALHELWRMRGLLGRPRHQ